MDKSAIRNFAIEARKILMKSAITEAGFYGITKEGCKSPIQKGQDFEVYETLAGTENRIFSSDIKRRANLVHAIEEQGFDQVIEETAYTWFNRIIAIRFMEVNDYLPTRVRVLSSETGSNTPDIVRQSLDVDLNMTPEELEKVQSAKDNNKYDEAFRLLFIKQCNELNDILPGLFEKTDDYMELLLKLSYTGDGVVRMLVDTVPEDSFNVETEGQVEIIGWMYQYYNTDNFNLVYDGNMSRKKIEKEYLPAATQLFTPDWVVKQMNQNTIVPLVFDEIDVDKYQYYTLDNSNEKIKLSEMEIIDPSMGSGHFLVNAFDIMMDAYISAGYVDRDASVEIINKNIFGLDIDKRAFQISYFSIFMKARQYNRRIFKENIDANICYLCPISKTFEKAVKTTTLLNPEDQKICLDLYYFYENIDEIGTLSQKSIISYEKISNLIVKLDSVDTENIIDYSDKKIIADELNKIKKQHYILNKKYNAVVTNPPYLGSARMSPILLKYVTKHYPDAKADLSMAFYDKAYQDLLKDKGRISFLTTTSWMYLTTYENFRKNMINSMTFSLLVEYGTELFDGKIGHLPIVSWTCIKQNEDTKMKAIRLVDFCYKNRNQKNIEYFKEKNWYLIDQNKFKDLPSYPIAYWLEEQFFDFMENKECLLDKLVTKKAGLVTGNDAYFIRYWFEVCNKDIDFISDSFDKDTQYNYNVIAKGGSSRQYYGNFEYVIKLKDLWNPDKTNVSVRRGDPDFYLKAAIGWSQIGNTQKTFRKIENAVCGTATPTVYMNDSRLFTYVLAYLNTKIARRYLDVFNPTLNLMSTDIGNLPIRIAWDKISYINQLVEEMINLYRMDWDENETSWNFRQHPYMNFKESGKLKIICEKVQKERTDRNDRIVNIQNELDQVFSEICEIDIDDLQNDKELNLREHNPRKDVEELLSYFVGCLLGRYSINTMGVLSTDGSDEVLSNNPLMDKDGILPITDELYFEDDIVTLVESCLSEVFGQENIENNMEYIANILDSKSISSRETIRNYFIKDFYRLHCQQYQKHPIYWLFNSGKQNGFKALIYVHRYDKNLIGLIRTDYLTKIQNAIERSLNNSEYISRTTGSATDRALAMKSIDKYVKQLNEIKNYYPALSHIALQQLSLDINDGVKENYAKFQGIEVSNEGTKKQTIDLLEKI